MIVSVLLTIEPEVSEALEPNNEGSPVSVVTRSQSKARKEVDEKETDKLLHNVMNRDELIKAQKSGNSLPQLHKIAVNKDEIVKFPCFLMMTDC